MKKALLGLALMSSITAFADGLDLSITAGSSTEAAVVNFINKESGRFIKQTGPMGVEGYTAHKGLTSLYIKFDAIQGTDTLSCEASLTRDSRANWVVNSGGCEL